MKTALLSAVILLSGCGVKLVIHQPYDIRRVCSVTALAIGIQKSQLEYHEHYFPRFEQALRESLPPSIALKGAPDSRRGYTWVEAARIGRELGVDAVVGLLIDDSSRPPARSQILKVVKSSNGKILAQQNRLMDPREDYSFGSEIKGLLRALKCSNKQ